MNSSHLLRSHGTLRFAPLLLVMVFGPLATRVEGQWRPQNPGTTASFRGMSVVSQDIVWISGTKGTFAWTTNGGTEWHPGQVPDAAALDFRAVHAISADTALLMVSALNVGLIYRTTDRGRTWSVVYRDSSKGAFLDAIAFFDSRHGLAVGDPVNGRFVILSTSDGGQHWSKVPEPGIPAALNGEGAFAASGTSLITCGATDAWLGSGGAATSRVYHSRDGGRTWSVENVPIDAGVASAGIFSLACRDVDHLVAVGGNYSKPNASATTVARSDDGGRTWTASAPSAATAFLSGVAYLDPSRGKRLIAVGTEGSAFSKDGGATWSQLDKTSLNVVMSLGHDDRAWAAGADGSLAEWVGRP